MKKPKFIPEFSDIPTPRQIMPELTQEERKLNFKEVELGLTEEMARKEASRCLSCRRCIGCGLCLAECDQAAVVYDETPKEITVDADAVILTSDGETFDASSKRNLNYCQSANVITSLELERLLSSTGPFGGLVLRPSDGEVPGRIAFIQCVGSREEAIGANYCSVECCSRTLAQAARIKDAVEGVGIQVFHRGLRPTGKRSEVELTRLEGETWIDFIEADVAAVSENREDGTVTVEYSADGEENQAQFDLVVLAVGIRARRDYRRQARVGGVGVNKFGFVEPSIGNYLALKDGVSLAGALYGPGSAETKLVAALGALSRSLEGCTSQGPEPKITDGGKPLVYACEYGLGLGGKDARAVEHLKANGFQVEGSFGFLCYKDGRQAMKDRIQGAGGLVVIGCHKGSHEELFGEVMGLAPEKVAILGASDLDEGGDRKLASVIEGVTKASGADKQAPKTSSVAIIGGGISGLAAAGELLRRRLKVTIIEKSDRLGGNLMEAMAAEGSEIDAAEGLLQGLEQNPGIAVFKSAQVGSVQHKDGIFTLTVSTPDLEHQVEVGAIVVATGSQPYLASEYPHDAETVLTQRELTARISKSDTPWKKMVMIQCVGARDSEHPYCSRFCCRQALDNAVRYKKSNPDSEITILHKGIRVFGFEEEVYTEAMESGVNFAEIEGKPVVEGPNPLKVRAKAKSKEALLLDCDAVVLSVAHSHGGEQEELARALGVPLDDLHFFALSNALGDPFATKVEGIFACGFSRGPVSAGEAFSEGLGAAGAACIYLSQ